MVSVQVHLISAKLILIDRIGGHFAAHQNGTITCLIKCLYFMVTKKKFA